MLFNRIVDGRTDRKAHSGHSLILELETKCRHNGFREKIQRILRIHHNQIEKRTMQDLMVYKLARFCSTKYSRNILQIQNIIDKYAKLLCRPFCFLNLKQNTATTLKANMANTNKQYTYTPTPYKKTNHCTILQRIYLFVYLSWQIHLVYRILSIGDYFSLDQVNT